MASITVRSLIKYNGQSVIDNTVTHTVQNVTILDEDIADPSTNLEIALAIDVSALKHFSMTADQTLTVYTNAAGTGAPQETFTLTAGLPIIWNEGDTAIFAGDVTSIFVTNASGSATVLNLIVGTNL